MLQAGTFTKAKEKGVLGIEALEEEALEILDWLMTSGLIFSVISTIYLICFGTIPFSHIFHMPHIFHFPLSSVVAWVSHISSIPFP